MLQLLLKLTSSRSKSALMCLIGKFGICSCITFDTLVETLVGNGAFYYNHLLAPTIFEYLFMTIEISTSATGISTSASAVTNEESITVATANVNLVNNKRKSIFFPLLVDQSLVSPVNSDMAAIIEASYNKNLIKRINEIFEHLDERALLISKYLVHSLKHYNRFIKVEIYLLYLKKNSLIHSFCLCR